MRSRWSERAEDVTPPPSPEEREADLERARVETAARALASGHDISRPRPGDGRCRVCKVRRSPEGRCLCGPPRPQCADPIEQLLRAHPIPVDPESVERVRERLVLAGVLPARKVEP